MRSRAGRRRGRGSSPSLLNPRVAPLWGHHPRAGVQSPSALGLGSAAVRAPAASLPARGRVCPFVSWRGERPPVLPPGVRGRPRRGAAAQSHLRRLRERRELPRVPGVSVRSRPHPGAQCPRSRGGQSLAWLQRFGLG